MSYSLHPLDREYLPELLSFADIQIGRGYFKPSDTEHLYEMGLKDGKMASWLLIEEESRKMMGLRLSFAPGKWLKWIHHRCYTQEWKVPTEKVGYFKSLFIDSSLRGQGWGPMLAEKSKEILRAQGAQAIVCHAWKESPHNSSVRYLEKFGFTAIGEWPLFWTKVDYDCVGCGVTPCQCTAVEMIYYFDPTPQNQP